MTTTPGPWTSAWHVQDYSILDARNHELARVWQADDARLIAAAPEMRQWLEIALEGLQAYYDYGQKMREIGRGFDWGDTPGASTETFVNRARALLARIEGKE